MNDSEDDALYDPFQEFEIMNCFHNLFASFLITNQRKKERKLWKEMKKELYFTNDQLNSHLVNFDLVIFMKTETTLNDIKMSCYDICYQ